LEVVPSKSKKILKSSIHLCPHYHFSWYQ